MNRKQRRATQKQSPSVGGTHARPAYDPPARLFTEAARHQSENRLDDAARIYKRVLQIEPDHAEAVNNLGAVFQAQGKLREASAYFAQSLSLMPQLFEQYSGVNATLLAVLPPIAEAMQRASKAWPNRLPVDQLLGNAGLTAIGDDPMLLCMLQSVPPRNFEFEHVMTSLRASLLDTADISEPAAQRTLGFCCALAKQCFINEYVFATTPDEDAKVKRLNATLGDAIKSGAAIAPLSIAAIAMYEPLLKLTGAQALLDRTWPSAVDGVLTQQLREPAQELALRASIPRLTPIEDDTSQRVRQQYEENPYPRWVNIAGGIKPVALDNFLRGRFPTAAFTPIGKSETLDVLVAGCGTGLQAAQTAQGCQGAHVLAVDLSLTSLSYAKRKTSARLSDRIEYAQGDILKLGTIGRSFDLIEASGVLHHMREPFEGWRILLSLLRPDGIMHLGFYSEVARGDVAAARAFIAQRGYASTPEDIRRCRQDLLQTPLSSVSRFSDFFSTSECRDLLFHVQESRMGIPAIKEFLDAHSLKFIGFDFKEAAAREFYALFSDAGWSMSDLGKWHALELKYPNTFADMYQFWVQKH
jgi:2-polyprenyl-3-methyl-5-hydroxy-6-metoxy-1,4-benzoquinol methylase/tetratricopeptide (TPR) repeat protein